MTGKTGDLWSIVAIAICVCERGIKMAFVLVLCGQLSAVIGPKVIKVNEMVKSVNSGGKSKWRGSYVMISVRAQYAKHMGQMGHSNYLHRRSMCVTCMKFKRMKIYFVWYASITQKFTSSKICAMRYFRIYNWRKLRIVKNVCSTCLWDSLTQCLR